jgi:hypothetical protein
VSPLFHGSDNPHISGMAKRKRETEWEVIRIKATPGAFIGLVQAPDKASALKTAINRSHRCRLIFGSAPPRLG